MAVIDADTHVDENEDTWSYMSQAERKYAPATVEGAQGIGLAKGYNRYWLVDGKLVHRRHRSDERTGTRQPARELTDVKARIAHMDELGVDIHTLYSTFFLCQPTVKPEVDVALARSYNRWLADRCANTGGRMRWLAIMPSLDMNACVEEIRFARNNGACGIAKRGIEIGQRRAGDEYFFPMYKAASEANLAVCMHLASGDPSQSEVLGPANGFWFKTLPLLDACNQMVMNDIPKKFPELRVGFIEAGAMWVPYVMSELRSRHERMAWFSTFQFSEDLFKASRFFVACQTHEDLDYLLKIGLEDSLVIGSDYTHADMTAEINALDVIKKRGEAGSLSKTVVRKMLEDNPAKLYGIA